MTSSVPSSAPSLYENSMSDSKTSTITFAGGAGTVTGANFLFESGELKILVDCGLTQGCKDCEDVNYEPFAFDPASISHLFVTHTHIDHIGRIPRLVAQGFKGTIYSTEATRDIAEHLLLDAVELLSREAQDAGRAPLYTEHDVASAMALWRGVSYEEKIELPEGFTVTFHDAGHILGSGMVFLEREGKRMVFTGDVGNDNSVLLNKTASIEGTTYLLTESVYGDREHQEEDMRRDELENVIEETLGRGGTLLIPAFSTERTQELIFEIRNLMQEKRVPSVPVYVDSPLASKITASFLKNPAYFKDDIAKRVAGGEDIFAFDELRFVATPAESKNIHKEPGPKIILAGSGMSNGGRMLSHEKVYLPDEKSTLLIVGYQSAGSLGRQLLEGAKQVVIFGEKVPVRARVTAIYGYSAHRDARGLLDLANQTADTLKQVFVVMGEPKASAFLTQRIRDYLGVNAVMPEKGESVTIDL